MDLATECWEIVAVLERGVEGMDVTEMLGRWRARALALEAAPAGVGWKWLAEHGDAGAAAVVTFERRGCADGEGDAQRPPGDGGRGS